LDARQQQIILWIENDLGYHDYVMQPASADASFRRYFRLKDNVNGDTKIVMDAPPEKENSHPFIQIAGSLQQLGLNVPKVYAQNFEQGFFLLSDLGSVDYLTKINVANADSLYQDAMQALLVMQAAKHLSLPAYDESLLQQEMNLFVDWFLVKHQRINLSASQQQIIKETFAFLSASALSQPMVCVHRDYHSRNLMVSSQQNPGVLDFQDAVMGPITYDLVSLLRDCYVTWPVEKVDEWMRYYHSLAIQKSVLPSVEYSQFETWFDLMGMQRHLKAVGIFSRLNYRDGKSGYLKDIPRTLSYLAKVGAKYAELQLFNLIIRGLE